ncbi:uncharacterized protein A4U43_C04F2420 [Asparagus officinalis]|uniref:Uncharacterized protein n=1 Tax=Asparagus officinalis TaxID=4686 RepID=A0A5P1EYC7_ASPOF|nr:uncharacterized protein A4U43_C04F2420 [Asparagus officinalis]
MRSTLPRSTKATRRRSEERGVGFLRLLALERAEVRARAEEELRLGWSQEKQIHEYCRQHPSAQVVDVIEKFSGCLKEKLAVKFSGEVCFALTVTSVKRLKTFRERSFNQGSSFRRWDQARERKSGLVVSNRAEKGIIQMDVVYRKRRRQLRRLFGMTWFGFYEEEGSFFKSIIVATHLHELPMRTVDFEEMLKQELVIEISSVSNPLVGNRSECTRSFSAELKLILKK